MDAMIRSKAEVLAREVAGSISTQQELGELMRFLTKSVIERMLDAEMDVHLGRWRTPASESPPDERAAHDWAQTGLGEADATADAGSLIDAAGAGVDESPMTRNRRNGRSSKTVKGETGPLELSTTNAIESVNSVIRRFTCNRKIYPNEESALKITFMAIREASKKSTMPIPNWKVALNHFAILFEGRLPQ